MEYQLRPDGLGLQEESCKQYLEDLLGMVRSSLIQKSRTTSSSSVASNKSAGPEVFGNTSRMSSARSIDQTIDEDMRYCMKQNKILIEKVNHSKFL